MCLWRRETRNLYDRIAVLERDLEITSCTLLAYVEVLQRAATAEDPDAWLLAYQELLANDAPAAQRIANQIKTLERERDEARDQIVELVELGCIPPSFLKERTADRAAIRFYKGWVEWCSGADDFQYPNGLARQGWEKFVAESQEHAPAIARAEQSEVRRG